MHPKLRPLDQQVVVITGASSGIGLVTARMAARRGARVMLVARSGEALERICEEIEIEGGTADFVVTDVGVLDDVRAAVRKTIERFGRIDSWVNDAGVAIYARLSDTPIDEHEALFRTNYFGMVHAAQTVMPYLQRDGGAFIALGSIASDIPSPLLGAYVASKHAIKGYIHSLRIEVTSERLPVAVTLIKPSGIDTPIAEHAANHLEGEALVPAPVYDPTVVARAILDAAEHPRRDVTVGGAGRLQVLLAQHFPSVLDHLGSQLEPMLHERSRPKTTANNLDRPVDEGRERSRIQNGRRFSLYTALARHAGPVLAGACGLAVILLLKRRRRSTS
jgi:short-subunit dehydrogenase